jgi:hypothetical protein
VVRDDQQIAAALGQISVHLRLDVEQPQQASAPAPHGVVPAWRFEERKYERSGRDADKQMQRRARGAINAPRQANARRPRRCRRSRIGGIRFVD